MKEYRDIIRAEIHSTAAELRLHKRWRKHPPEDRPPPPATRFGLFASKLRATLLCTVMAHSRGRCHALGDLTAQATALTRALDAMDAMKWQTPVLDAGLRATARAILAPHACVAPTEERRA